MASGSYDQRPRTSDGPQSRRNDHHDQYASGRRSRDHSPSASSRLRPDARYSSSRYTPSASQPGTRSASPAVNRPRQPRSTWPPQPKVEDEKASLAKESRPPVADSDRNEGPSRGVVDQQPIMLETEYYPRQRSGSNTPQKRQTTSRSKDRLKTRNASTKAEPSETPVFTGRSPSPYVFTPRAPESARFGSTDSGYFSSADGRASSKLERDKSKNKDAHLPDNRSASDALRGKGMSRNSFSSTNRPSNGVEERDFAKDDSTSTASGQGSRNPARYSLNQSDLQEKELRTSLRDLGVKDGRPRLAELKADAVNEPRRNTESSSTIQRPRFSDGPRPPRLQDLPPQSISTTNSPAVTPTSTFSSGDYFQSPNLNRNSGIWTESPSNPSVRGHSPPRSRENSVSKGTPRSARNSRPNSLYGSRPPSPASSDYSRSEYSSGGPRRSSTFPVVLDYENKPRAGSSNLAQEPDTTSYVQSQTNKSSALPYPVDDMNIMPSEVDHQYKPRALGDPFVPRVTGQSRVPTNAGSRTSEISESSPISPRVNSRHSMTGDLSSLNTMVDFSAARPEPSPMTARTATPPVRALVPCPRTRSSRGYDDWYTLDGAPYVDMCPTCVESNFKGTSFMRYFYQNTNKDTQKKTKCDFGSPWMRLAWLLTKKQQRYDINLLYTLARIQHDESSCPGDHNESRTWYSPSDKRGNPIDGFDVCYTDVKRIETLVPSARGLFVRNTHSSGHRRKCDMRIESKRFTEYLDLLIEIEEVANTKRRQPELHRFIEYARHKAEMQECARDTVLKDGHWHFMHELPEFTVCEECYALVVWPAIEAGSPLACRFNQSPQLVHWGSKRGDRRSGGGSSLGNSCQLYSTRMRRVFKKAVQADDFRYLASRAQERRDVELELQTRFAATKRLASDAGKMAGRNGVPSSATRGIEMEFDRIAAEWEKWE